MGGSGSKKLEEQMGFRANNNQTKLGALEKEIEFLKNTACTQTAQIEHYENVHRQMQKKQKEIEDGKTALKKLYKSLNESYDQTEQRLQKFDHDYQKLDKEVKEHAEKMVHKCSGLVGDVDSDLHRLVETFTAYLEGMGDHDTDCLNDTLSEILGNIQVHLNVLLGMLNTMENIEPDSLSPWKDAHVIADKVCDVVMHLYEFAWNILKISNSNQELSEYAGIVAKEISAEKDKFLKYLERTKPKPYQLGKADVAWIEGISKQLSEFIMDIHLPCSFYSLLPVAYGNDEKKQRFVDFVHAQLKSQLAPTIQYRISFQSHSGRYRLCVSFSNPAQMKGLLPANGSSEPEQALTVVASTHHGRHHSVGPRSHHNGHHHSVGPGRL